MLRFAAHSLRYGFVLILGDSEGALPEALPRQSFQSNIPNRRAYAGAWPSCSAVGRICFVGLAIKSV